MPHTDRTGVTWHTAHSGFLDLELWLRTDDGLGGVCVRLLLTSGRGGGFFQPSVGREEYLRKLRHWPQKRRVFRIISQALRACSNVPAFHGISETIEAKPQDHL